MSRSLQSLLSQKAARRRISTSVEEGDDYMQVVVGALNDKSLNDALADLDDDDEADPADSDDE